MKQKDRFGVLELYAYCIGYILLITIYRFLRTNEFDAVGFLKIAATIFVVATATFAIFNKGSFKKTSSDYKLPMIMITAVVSILVSVFIF